jgi:hypothetical protein
MTFMRPEITAKQEWAGVETTAGFWWVPIDVLSKSEIASARRGDFDPLLKYTEGSEVYSDLSSIKKGYGVRLSASGYMDATDWEVYGSKKEALRRAKELVEEEEEEGTSAPGHATKKSPSRATKKSPSRATKKSPSRATKKSPAQLNREIAEALSRTPSQRTNGNDGKRSSRGSRHHSTMAADEKIRAAIARFPATFGLRGFPGDVFRLSPTASYINDSGRVTLYTQRKDGTQWLDFAKGTESELRREVTS